MTHGRDEMKGEKAGESGRKLRTACTAGVTCCYGHASESYRALRIPHLMYLRVQLASESGIGTRNMRTIAVIV